MSPIIPEYIDRVLPWLDDEDVYDLDEEGEEEDE